jgi:hypothetical protein
VITKTCSDCATAAAWIPCVLYYADRRRWPNATPARSLCGIYCCDEHRKNWTLDILVTDKSFEQIAHVFGMYGKARPDRSATELTFVRIETAEAQSFLRASLTH